MASWQSMVRGNVPSDGRVERYVHVWRRANRGRASPGSDRAVNYTDQTLNQIIPKTHPWLREVSGGGLLSWWGRFTPHQCRQPPQRARLVGSTSGAGPPPPGVMLCRAHRDAQWNWHTPLLLLHRAWLLGPFSFKLFSLSFPLFVFFFECPTLLTYDSTGV